MSQPVSPDQFRPVPYSDELETEEPNEAELIDRTISTMQNTMSQAFELHRHATTATHAKSHGLVKGHLQIADDLPAELAQGMFAAPNSYDVFLRIASEPGFIDPDTASRARGAALKILDVPGDKLRAGWTSQDFLFNTWPVIPQGTVAVYLNAIEQRDKHFGNHAAASAGTMAHHRDVEEALFDRTPNIHPLAYTFYTQSAFRHGDYVGKYSLAPVSEAQTALADRKVSHGDPPGILSQWVQEYFKDNDAVYELRVQLLTDPDSMPVEDASVEWPEAKSPYRRLATITFPRQESWGAARRVFAEDVMSWRPWYSLAAHRPLGSLNRLRNKGYEVLGGVRHDVNATTEKNPASLSDIPD